MVNLFVDCDDTLMEYLKAGKVNPYGFWKNISFKPNLNLIEDIRKFREANPKSTITVWSGGGRTYAKECATELGIEQSVDRFLLKEGSNLLLVEEGDIVVDDLEGIRTHTPSDRF